MNIGTAGWSISKAYAPLFPVEGSHLVRYAQVLNCAEINSSFYREHQAKTYARWAQDVPAHFRFSVKLSKQFIHEQRLDVDADELKASLENIFALKKKLGVILVQLPASLHFEKKIARSFFTKLRKHYTGLLALEPRHVSWVDADALKLLHDFEISKVIADPERVKIENSKLFSEAVSAGGLVYYRLHGSPQIYKSAYTDEYLQTVAQQLKAFKKKGLQCWCIFDNTTFGHSLQNAVDLQALTEQSKRP